MAALGPPSICDLSLNANTPQGIFDGSFVKTTFEYVIAILTLVRVSFPLESHLCVRSPATGPERADKGRFDYRTGRTLFQNVPRVRDSR